VYDAFILAAGLGTRLRPLTEHRPKPLVPVCGVPLLSYSLAACHKHGLTRVVMNAHWLSDQIEAWAGEHEGIEVHVSTELPDILGTGGGLKKVAEELAPTFVVLNADVLHDVDLTALRAAVPAGGAAMALRPHAEDASRYGVVAADAEQIVVELVKVARAEARGAVDRGTHFTGIHALDRATLERVPAGFADIVRTAYQELVPQRLVAGRRYAGIWLDAGDPAAYLDANLEVLSGRHALPLDPFEDAAWCRTGEGKEYGDPSVLNGAVVEGAAWIGREVELGAGVRLRDVVLGAGARVPAGVTLSRSVVWDDGEVPAGAHDGVIVHPGGVLTTV
jgi:mannose-1-phosphate guanylyltransferase